MFATILRRWRLVTPLVTLATVISVVGGMAMTGASAHTVESAAFQGRAIGSVQTNVFPHEVFCDTGNLVRHGGSQELEADTGALSGSDGDFAADQCNGEVNSHLGKHSASVKSTVTLQDVAVGSDGDLSAETITATANASCSGSKTHKSWSSFFNDAANGDGFVNIGGQEIQVTGDANQHVEIVTPADNEKVTVILNEKATSKRAISLTAAHVIETNTTNNHVTDEFFIGNALAGVHCDV